MDKYDKLYYYCIKDDLEELKALLQQETDIDLVGRDGICFQIALKHGNFKILIALLEYFKANNKSKESEDQLKKILIEELQDPEIPHHIENLINDYIPLARYKGNLISYQNILARFQMMADKAENTIYLEQVTQLPQLPPNISDIPPTYKVLETFHGKLLKLGCQIQESLCAIDESTRVSLEKFKWALDGCQLYLEPFIQDLKIQLGDYTEEAVGL
ncbi:hypothetical protein phytr_9190 [Candidatus Phycorickettsia trachydisci]|uniref:Ankyrin repeat protein n=1 Tax=Candidatus Phycorickettsia trachydisci TaxID=2115978 RepID=A0A2P1P995_9RICK|nr:ankyrin repeat domain-containing protein [Candidatus Phycorickettsia trachydisci]AVP87848.1 hypothetical protein phytr_9190 [Candidatus Phycorickettsia trachydisci]